MKHQIHPISTLSRAVSRCFWPQLNATLSLAVVASWQSREKIAVIVVSPS